MLEELYRNAEERMRKSVAAFQTEIARLRTGRASPALLEGLKVEAYNTQLPINQVASILAPEPRLLIVQPWDKNIIGAIERAIRKSGLGLNPQSDGNVIRIPIPPLSEERRQDLVKVVRKLAEEARIAIRNIRRDVIEKIRAMEKNKEISEDDRHRAEEKIQKLTEKYVEEIDDLLARKEKEILEE